MALQEKTAKLVDKLIDLSGQGKVSWEETADENTFLTSVGNFVVSIAKPEASVFTLTISDQAGRTLDETRDHVNDFYTSPDYSRVSTLHELARRRALNVDAALTEMLSSLEQIH
jgi:hypothetical protein